MKKSISTLLFYFFQFLCFLKKYILRIGNHWINVRFRLGLKMPNLVFLFTGDYTLCRDGRLKELIPNGISIGWKTRN